MFSRVVTALVGCWISCGRYVGVTEGIQGLGKGAQGFS